MQLVEGIKRKCNGREGEKKLEPPIFSWFFYHSEDFFFSVILSFFLGFLDWFCESLQGDCDQMTHTHTHVIIFSRWFSFVKKSDNSMEFWNWKKENHMHKFWERMQMCNPRMFCDRQLSHNFAHKKMLFLCICIRKWRQKQCAPFFFLSWCTSH